MKNPHNKSDYVKVDADKPQETPAPKKNNLSGAYYYVDKDAERLATMSFARTALTVIAFLLQVVVLLFPEQAGAMYVSKHIASYGLLYVIFTFFGMFAVSIWLVVMNQIRYKITKRIPVERAPKNGFKRRVYFGLELYMAVMAVMTAFQLSFVCIRYDGWGLGAFFVSLLSLAAAVAARQLTHLTLRDAELIPAPAEEDNKEEDTNNK